MTRNPKTKKARSVSTELAELAAGRGRGVPAAAKRGPGRPPRQDEPQRIAVLIPGSLKRWLRIASFEQGRDMGDLVAEGLELLRAKKP